AQVQRGSGDVRAGPAFQPAMRRSMQQPGGDIQGQRQPGQGRGVLPESAAHQAQLLPVAQQPGGRVHRA
ncbi:unnamed protein product, partial [Closterium sp. NIES-54]